VADAVSGNITNIIVLIIFNITSPFVPIGNDFFYFKCFFYAPFRVKKTAFLISSLNDLLVK